MDERDRSLLNDIKERRKNIIELIIIAVLFGISLNLFNNALYKWFFESLCKKDEKIFFISSSVILLIIVYFIIRFFTKDKIEQAKEFRMLLPFKRDFNNTYVEQIKGYAPSMYADKIISPFLNKNHDVQEALKHELAVFSQNIGTYNFFGLWTK